MDHDRPAPGKPPPAPDTADRCKEPVENACNPARATRGPLDHQADGQDPRRQAQ
ncbi:hypothetical protein [Gemmobacter sp.]|uniref:hypothetical protein n=1 Tax=Gemmobacter sp. TaxID=1898957 RepID=UPI002AFF2CC2|nr:hypothetical protein [Gemmobacter sp.]